MANRQSKRLLSKDQQRAQRTEPRRAAVAEEIARTRERTPPPEYLREVRQELRKVAWPGRQEVVSYTIVVLAVTAVLTAIVFGMDYIFGELVFEIFGG